MNYKLFLQITIIITILLTLCICIKKPQMHKNLFIYNSDYDVVEQTIKTQKSDELPTIKTITTKNNTDKKVDTKKSETKQTQKIDNNTKTNSTVTRPQTTTKKQENKIKPSTTTKTKEEIQWNIWHSNIQNQIMKETTLPPIPKGTIFKFSFNVDKYGRISNIQTYSETPIYTPYAIEHIAPVIRSLQGRPILEFPKGSNRTITIFTGGWKITDKSKYSTPQDFQDTEVINKKVQK